MARAVIWTALAGMALGALAGCYSKVIRASGPGAWQYKVEESDVDNDAFSNFEKKK
ncbi:MAG TPA: hypothetical protein VG797_06865 [Phycisphaerales bacterium]|nr:hypothetical protein [Phycisphaerales bacterium]